MTGIVPTPQKEKRNIVADMRARPRKPVEVVPEPVSPIKRIFSGLLSRIKPAATPETDTATAIEKNRKLAERLESLEDQSWEIRESEELHRGLAEAFGDIIIDRDATGNISFANRFAEQYFGDNHPVPEPHLAEYEERSAPISRDIEIDTLLGKRWLSWTDIELRDGTTGERRVRSVGRDITERKRDEASLAQALEAAKAASEVKSRFLAMVSHEMRTPLNGIAGMARLLADTKLDAAQRDHVGAIDHSSGALLALVEDLLDGAQIDAGEMQLRPKPTNLRDLVAHSAEMLASRAAMSGLAIASFVDPALPVELMIDGGRLRQVLLNLGGNAVKFTKLGGVALEVTGSVSKNLATITISVTDSGPGLAAEDQQAIFTEFTQAAAGSDRQHDGAGLGLFIAQQIARLMGSTIEVSSVPGRGSRFALTFEAEIAGGKSDTLEPNEPQKLCVALITSPNPARSALLRSIRALVVRAHSFDSIPAFIAAAESGSIATDVILVNRASLEETGIAALRQKIGPPTRLILIDHANSTKISGQDKPDGWLTWPIRFGTLQKILANDAVSSPETKTEYELPAGQPNQRRALLVEDNDINTIVARNFLEKLDFAVTHFPDGPGAIEAFKEALANGRPFDHVLLDLNMPGMDGWSVLSQLRELEAGAERSNILILSADARTETREEVLKAGANGFIAKPLDFDKLSTLLNDELENGSAAVA